MIFKTKTGELDLSRPLIMGILNVTPDSFSDGGYYLRPIDAIRHGEELIRVGADIIDIGGQSTRPGHTPVSADEEWSRIAEVIPALRGKAPISVDTFYPEVAKRALRAGADIINDVTGFRLLDMRQIAAFYGAGCIIMHDLDISRAPVCDIPALMQGFFRQRIAQCIREGVERECICLDCGIGFGKTREQEEWIIDNVDQCGVEGFPMLIGASRKRLIRHILRDQWPEPTTFQLDTATHAAHLRAIRAGANIIRVHHVCGAKKSLEDL